LADPSVVYATEGRYIWKSEDGGASWKSIPYSNVAGPASLDIAVSSVDSDIVVVSSGGIIDGPALFISQDGGKKWARVVQNYPDYLASQIVFSHSHPNIVFTRPLDSSGAVKKTLAWSENTGETWHFMAEVDSIAGWLHISPGDPDMLYFGRSGTNRGLFRGPVTTREWESVDLGPLFSDGSVVRRVTTDPESPHRIVVALSNGIILSEDDGSSWEGISNLSARYIAIDPHDSNRLWVGGDFGLAAVNIGSVAAEPEVALQRPAMSIYPNPARDHVTISFEAPAGEPVTVRVYDLLGRVVTRLLDARPASGAPEQVVFHPHTHGLPSATYILILSTSSSAHARPITIVGR
jgi:hypothetical protein